MSICKVEWCDKSNKNGSLGYCSRHYTQMIRYGEIIRTIYDKNEIIIYNDYAEICLYRGMGKQIEVARTKIDLDDVEKCKLYKWRLQKSNYVFSESVGQLHNYIMGNINKNIIVDHINRNKLDNRKSNLRNCKYEENCYNSSLPSHNTSGVMGVSFDKTYEKWSVYIGFNNQTIRLGKYESFEDAVKVRLKAELKYFGEFSPQIHLFNDYGVNFPNLNGDFA